MHVSVVGWPDTFFYVDNGNVNHNTVAYNFQVPYGMNTLTFSWRARDFNNVSTWPSSQAHLSSIRRADDVTSSLLYSRRVIDSERSLQTAALVVLPAQRGVVSYAVSTRWPSRAGACVRCLYG